MPNWVEQILSVAGPKTEIDRFIRTGLVRHRRDEMDDVLDFERLCPLKSRDRKDTYTHQSGVVLCYFRTRTQAMFSMITSWDYPAEFYARLPRHWPALAFGCSVNEDMGQFGGILLVLNGEVINLVRDYNTDYSLRSHRREIRAAQKRWSLFLTQHRPWRVDVHAPWKHKSMPTDAHFDDDFRFYFRTRDELAQFRERYKTTRVMRLTVDGWRRARSK